MADLSPPADQLLSSAWLKVRLRRPPVFQVILVVSLGSLVIFAPLTAFSSAWAGFWAFSTSSVPKVRMDRISSLRAQLFRIIRQFYDGNESTKILPLRPFL